MKEDVGRPLVAHDEHDVTLPVGFVRVLWHRAQLSQVNAADPIVRDRQTGRCRPRASVQVLGGGLSAGPGGPVVTTAAGFGTDATGKVVSAYTLAVDGQLSEQERNGQGFGQEISVTLLFYRWLTCSQKWR